MALTKTRARQVQTLLKAAGYYTGEIDGAIGPKSRLAINTLVNRRLSELTSPKMSEDRRAIAAGQLVLKHAGHPVGAIDGYWGNATEGSWLEWDHLYRTGSPLSLEKRPQGPASPIAGSFPRQVDCGAFYGAPGPAVERQLVMIDLPFPMRLDWALSTTVKRAQLHKKCADSALVALNRILSHYGYDRLRELGLDRTAGTYNHRRMRGGTSWSMHAYGCAWDFYAGKNGLNTKCPQALFCGSEYKAWLDIWESVGWVSLGRAIGRDYMHVQAARL